MGSEASKELIDTSNSSENGARDLISSRAELRRDILEDVGLEGCLKSLKSRLTQFQMDRKPQFVTDLECEIRLANQINAIFNDMTGDGSNSDNSNSSSAADSVSYCGVNLTPSNVIRFLAMFWEHDTNLLCNLLSLGLSPDEPNEHDGRRPSHVCSIFGNAKAARILVDCRPDLLAKDDVMKLTPRERARASASKWETTEDKKACEEVAEIWGAAATKSFPSIAELAANQKWYAVQNLCRRRLVTAEERQANHEGMNAIQWAVHHGQEALAEEIVHFFTPVEDHILSMAGALKLLQEKVDEQAKAMQQIIGTSSCIKDMTMSSSLKERVADIEEQLTATKNGLQLEKDNVARLVKENEKCHSRMENLERTWMTERGFFQNQMAQLQELMLSVMSSSQE